MSLFGPDTVPGRPYWWDDVTWPELEGELPATTDLLVIGAGYTGLCAAIAAHDAGARVVVIDSGQPGEGASTRNGGMVGAHPRLDWDTLADRYGPNTADALFTEAGAALDWVKAMIAGEGIDCDLQDTGRIQLAYTPGHFEAQKRLAIQLSEKGGVPCQVIERDGLPREIASPIYKGGILFPDHGAVHPAKFFLGMLAAALRRDIPVLAHRPAMKLFRDKAGIRVVTSRGQVFARRVVLATNGYTSVQFPWFARRVFPVPSYLIATEPLPANLIGALAPGGRMMVETRARHCYYRVSPDGTRILFGARASLVNIDLDKAAQRLHQSMLQIWPNLRHVKLSHVWTGNTGFAFNRMPHVGEAGGLHYAMGYSGGGVVLAPWLGRKAALRALDLPEGATAFAETRLASRWFFQSGPPRFMRAADLWYRHRVDPREDREAGL